MKKIIPVCLLFLGACTANGLLSDLTGAEGTGVDNTPFFPADRAYVFVTSQTTRGDMQGLTAGGCSGGGLAQADCACTALAKSANLLRRRDSRFAAWLSTATDYARCRILGQTGTAACNTGGENWYYTNNTLFSAGIATLLSTSGGAPLPNGMNIMENGVLSSGTFTYTGTLSSNGGLATSGAVAVNHCNSWSANSTFSAEAGAIFGNTSSWTENGAQTCDQQLPVYCFALP